MARRWPRINHFRAILILVTFGVQVPAVIALGALSGAPALAAAFALLITTPYLAGLGNPFEDRPKAPLYLYAGLWPFFVWWMSCFVFALLGPVAFVVGRASGLPATPWLLGAAALSLGAGLVACLREPRMVRRDVPVADLPAAFEGYRVAHLSDVHCGSYTPEARVASWVARINALEPDLVAVTGDLITNGQAFLEAAARALGGLRGRDGAFVSMGNHDYFGSDGERLVALLEREGLTVLRNRGQRVERDGATLFVAGVDDTWSGRADLPGALAGRPPGVTVLLLAHDPNLFPEAAAHAVELVLSGHTHGGQLAVPGMARRLNLARIVTAFSSGLYQLGRSTLYVSNGAGTTGPPVRLGAAPEITLLTLRAA
jgi:predicted MPP superfamily phosphohydrolase